MKTVITKAQEWRYGLIVERFYRATPPATRLSERSRSTSCNPVDRFKKVHPPPSPIAVLSWPIRFSPPPNVLSAAGFLALLRPPPSASSLGDGAPPPHQIRPVSGHLPNVHGVRRECDMFSLLRWEEGRYFGKWHHVFFGCPLGWLMSEKRCVTRFLLGIICWCIEFDS